MSGQGIGRSGDREIRGSGDQGIGRSGVAFTHLQTFYNNSKSFNYQLTTIANKYPKDFKIEDHTSIVDNIDKPRRIAYEFLDCIKNHLLDQNVINAYDDFLTEYKNNEHLIDEIVKRPKFVEFNKFVKSKSSEDKNLDKTISSKAEFKDLWSRPFQRCTRYRMVIESVFLKRAFDDIMSDEIKKVLTVAKDFCYTQNEIIEESINFSRNKKFLETIVANVEFATGWVFGI